MPLLSGIVFLKTKNLEKLKDFYTSTLNMNIWLDQEDCIILKRGNLLLGFCEREEVDHQGIITFFYRTKEEVDGIYSRLAERSLQQPAENKKYKIYQFFARDPENRLLEFQAFLHPLGPYLAGEELLVTRRSIRNFEETPIAEEILWKVFEICRYSPTSRNSQSYYYIVLEKAKHGKKIEFLASLRGSNSQPIARSPLVVAICSDSSKTGRPEQDACIAAYHFILASWLHGLGTCWIAAMDRDDVKETLDIPKDHHVATVTPLGYPKRTRGIPERKKAVEMVKFLSGES